MTGALCEGAGGNKTTMPSKENRASSDMADDRHFGVSYTNKCLGTENRSLDSRNLEDVKFRIVG